jgi:hypothetical protein
MGEDGRHTRRQRRERRACRDPVGSKERRSSAPRVIGRAAENFS